MQKGKKKPDTPVDPATMYESLKNRIQALEEEEVMEEEEERKFGEHAVCVIMALLILSQLKRLRRRSKAWKKTLFMQNISNL